MLMNRIIKPAVVPVTTSGEEHGAGTTLCPEGVTLPLPTSPAEPMAVGVGVAGQGTWPAHGARGR